MLLSTRRGITCKDSISKDREDEGVPDDDRGQNREGKAEGKDDSVDEVKLEDNAKSESENAPVMQKEKVKVIVRNSKTGWNLLTPPL